MGITIKRKVVRVPGIPERYEDVPAAYEWEGDTGIISRRDYPNLAIGDFVTIGPYTGCVVDVDYASNGFVVKRVSENDSILSAAVRLGYEVEKLKNTIINRLLWTLNIWGLAETLEGNIPSWDDIRILRKWRK